MLSTHLSQTKHKNSTKTQPCTAHASHLGERICEKSVTDVRDIVYYAFGRCFICMVYEYSL